MGAAAAAQRAVCLRGVGGGWGGRKAPRALAQGRLEGLAQQQHAHKEQHCAEAPRSAGLRALITLDVLLQGAETMPAVA
jgi:hypothetical protein